jgi:signal transduction histidine kinase
MIADQGDRAGATALAVLRAVLVVVILVCEQLVDRKQLGDTWFFIILGLAAAYAAAGIIFTVRGASGRFAQAFRRTQPVLDVICLTSLCYTSGGAFSDVRKAFFVIPLAAAFSERTRSTAGWSLLAVVTFTVVAALAGGHPRWAVNSWQRVTLNQDLYLAWTGAAATLLALALRRRSARTQELADSRQRLVTHAIDSVERERTRLAGALHDVPVQNLIAARHDLRRAQRTGDEESFQRVHEAIDATIAELREEIFKLYPHVLDQVGLSAALEQVARHHAPAAGAEITVAVHVDIAPAKRQVLFALGRELLTNAAKHARANRIALSVDAEGGSVILEVSDDGCGIPRGRIRQALLDGHIGLAAVTERVAALGGTLDVISSPARGSTVRIVLPVLGDDREALRDVSDRGTALDTPLVTPA